MSTTNRLLFFFIYILVSIHTNGQTGPHYPGGVPGCEVWYMADELDIGNGMFTDHSAYPVQIDNCDGYGYALFNFNPSLNSDRLCLQYRSHLERSLNRTTFIVTEPKDLQDSYPHIGTEYNQVVISLLGQAYEDSLSMNTYIIETQQGFASRMVSGFSQHQNASVHFYSWNNYDIDKTAKSYGQLGETDFFIGRKISHPDLDGGPDFSGLMPEYIAFDRQLTENERNRVESYLALKYGITKWHPEHYQSSQNKIFWDKANNGHFHNNIFGIGRDDMSGLNQLQCESAHAKDFLVAAIYEIMGTNAELQDNYGIENNEFLVFGDTGQSEIVDSQNLQRLYRVWLAQVRGDGIKGTPIRFRLDLMRAFEAAPSLVELVIKEELTLWMLHDPFVNNSFVSDFDNGRIKYYKPFDIDYGPNGEVYALFGEDDIFFDRDNGFFDQFTFAIGPDCLAQFRPRYDCEEAAASTLECYELDIILTGQCDGEVEFINEGEEHHEVWFNDEQTEINGEPTYTVYICAPGSYTAIIHVGSGTFEFGYEAAIIEQFYVDLGSDVQYLSAQQPEILLDAGQAMADPESATYQWFFNGVQIYGHYESTLVVDQPGDYCVVVTSGDGVCEIEKCVKVIAELEVQIDCHPGGCNPSEYQIQITILNGVPPFTTVVVEPLGQSTTHVHQGDTVITGLAQGENQGEFIITITDSLGSVYVGSCFFYEAFHSTESLGPDLTLSSSSPQFTLDASSSFGGPQNYTYQWLRNGLLLPQGNSPQLLVDTPGLYTAKVYLPDLDCYGYATQTVHSVLEGTITQDNDCDEFTNTIIVEIDFGFAPYEISIIGTTASGGSYNLQQGGIWGILCLVIFLMEAIPLPLRICTAV